MDANIEKTFKSLREPFCIYLGLEFIVADFQANAVLFRKYILTICQLIIYLITPLHPL